MIYDVLGCFSFHTVNNHSTHDHFKAANRCAKGENEREAQFHLNKRSSNIVRSEAFQWKKKRRKKGRQEKRRKKFRLSK